MSTTTAAPEANSSAQPLPPGLKPPRIAEGAFIIPLDAPEADEPSTNGMYFSHPGLPWLVEDLGFQIRGIRSLIAMVGAAACDPDCLPEQRLTEAMHCIESQLERCAAIADHVTRRLIATKWVDQ